MTHQLVVVKAPRLGYRWTVTFWREERDIPLSSGPHWSLTLTAAKRRGRRAVARSLGGLPVVHVENHP
jgi:hypothetical protein